MNRTVLAGAVVFTALAVALVIGTQITGVDSSATPWVTSVLGFIGLSVSQLLNNKSTEETKAKTTELNDSLTNGTFERLLREAVVKIAQDDTTALNITESAKDGESE